MVHLQFLGFPWPFLLDGVFLEVGLSALPSSLLSMPGTTNPRSPEWTIQLLRWDPFRVRHTHARLRAHRRIQVVDLTSLGDCTSDFQTFNI